MGNIVSGHDLIGRMGHEDVFGTWFFDLIAKSGSDLIFFFYCLKKM